MNKILINSLIVLACFFGARKWLRGACIGRGR